MTVHASVAARNAKLNALIALIGASPVLKIIEGSLPSNTASADAGTVLSTLTLGATWAMVANGTLTLSGTPIQDTSADASGTAGHWRLFDSAGTCHLQGDITFTGGGGSLTLASTSISLGGLVQITSGTFAEGNAGS